MSGVPPPAEGACGPGAAGVGAAGPSEPPDAGANGTNGSRTTAGGVVAGPPARGAVGDVGAGGFTVTTPDGARGAGPGALWVAVVGRGPLQTCGPAPGTTAKPQDARKASAPTAVHTVVGTARHRVIVCILPRRPPPHLRSAHSVSGTPAVRS